MKVFRNRSLRTKLVGVFLVPTLVIVLLYGLLAYFAARRGLEDLEKQLVLRAFRKADGVKTETARKLGIKTSALYYKIDMYEIDEEDLDGSVKFTALSLVGSFDIDAASAW